MKRDNQSNNDDDGSQNGDSNNGSNNGGSGGGGGGGGNQGGRNKRFRGNDENVRLLIPSRVSKSFFFLNTIRISGLRRKSLSFHSVKYAVLKE